MDSFLFSEKEENCQNSQILKLYNHCIFKSYYKLTNQLTQYLTFYNFLIGYEQQKINTKNSSQTKKQNKFIKYYNILRFFQQLPEKTKYPYYVISEKLNYKSGLIKYTLSTYSKKFIEIFEQSKSTTHSIIEEANVVASDMYTFKQEILEQQLLEKIHFYNFVRECDGEYFDKCLNEYKIIHEYEILCFDKSMKYTDAIKTIANELKKSTGYVEKVLKSKRKLAQEIKPINSEINEIISTLKSSIDENSSKESE